MKALFKSALIATCAFGMSTAAMAQPAEDFYKGKQITILVGFTTGNGADSYARLISRWLSKYIPGNPTVVVQNMPGSGSLTMTNYLYNVAPKDGLTFGIFNRNVPLEPLMGNAAAKFDPSKFNWLGSTNTEPSLCVSWNESGILTLDDMKQRNFTVAATGINANSGLVPTILNRVLGTKIKIVMGYPGGNEMNLAMERREVDGRCGWSRSSLMASKPDWVANKKVSLLVQAGLQKSPLMQEVPLAMDGVKNEKDRQLLKLAVAWDEMAWPFALPPQVPAERVATMRAAFAAVLKDPELQVQAQKEGLDLALVEPQKIEQILADIYATPADVVETMKEIMKGK